MCESLTWRMERSGRSTLGLRRWDGVWNNTIVFCPAPWGGAKRSVYPYVFPSVMLSAHKPLDESNQICKRVAQMVGVCNDTIVLPQGDKIGQISSNFIQRFFKSKFVYLLKKCRYIIYETGFSFGRLGHAPGVGIWRTMLGGWGQKFIFTTIQPNLVCELLF